MPPSSMPARPSLSRHLRRAVTASLNAFAAGTTRSYGLAANCRISRCRQFETGAKVRCKERLMSRFVSSQKLLIGVAIVSSLGIGYALGAQPHMDAALVLLQNARAELEKSEP